MKQPGRRSVLKGLGVVGCSLAAHPLTTTVTLANAPGDTRLVVILLRGGMDGLDVLRPVGDPMLRRLRPSLAAEPGLPLDGFHELHPALKGLLPLWRSGELAFVQAVSTPYRDKRSHFDGQDMLETGAGPTAGDGSVRGGWLNRALAEIPGATVRTAFAVGRETPLILAGGATVGSWSPEIRLDLTPQSRLLLEQMYRGDPAFHAASAEAISLADGLNMGSEVEDFDDMMAASQTAPRTSGLKDLAKFTAERLRDDTRIAAFSLPGWDTHRAQSNTLPRALRTLEGSVLALRDGLGPHWQKTVILAMTEFGRTAAENGSRGTDHGTGGLLIAAGGAVRGGRVLGTFPGLEEAALYERRDLMPTDDVRRWSAWALRGLFGVGNGALEDTVFPGLDLGADTGLLL